MELTCVVSEVIWRRGVYIPEDFDDYSPFFNVVENVGYRYDGYARSCLRISISIYVQRTLLFFFWGGGEAGLMDYLLGGG